MRNSLLLLGAFMILPATAPVLAQTADSTLQQKPVRLSLSGPRVGFTVLTGDDAKKLKEKLDAGPVVTQFGWQYEQQFLATKDGLAGLSEWVVLIGGAEQGVVLPSITWLVGVRTKHGTEFAVGPNFSITGAGMAFAAGVTNQTESLNFPMNLAIVLGKGGVRLAFLVGFNARE